jgi:hypothetical protein
MSEHKYWTHLIKLQANQTPGAKYWEGKAQVQYNDGRAFRFFEVHGPAEEFTSKEEAEQHVLRLAKTLIDKFI